MEMTMSGFWKLFQFENRIKDELANVFSITDGCLWRRDLTRMVVLQLPVPKKGHYDYSMEGVLRSPIKKIKIKDDMKLIIETVEGKTTLEPIQRTQPHSIKYVLRKNQQFLHEVELNVNELKRILLICEQKWLVDKVEDPKIMFDFQNGKIKMEEREEEFDIPVNKKIEKSEFIVSYSFHLMKDLMYNKFKETILFRISENYTIMEYDKNVYSVIMHCQ